jgi:hypothetical protein
MNVSTSIWQCKLGFGRVGSALRASGLTRFGAAANYVKSLPYGRTFQPADPLSILREHRGTCSTKHALLALAAGEMGSFSVELMLCFFDMNERTTKGVGRVLKTYGLTSIPEAHCYLRIAGSPYDFTGLPQSTESPLDNIFSEEVVAPHELLAEKAARHRAYIRAWAKQHNFDPEVVWQAREKCIEALSTHAGQQRA